MPVRGIAAEVARTPDTLRVRFTLDGDLEGLALPAPGSPRPGSRLWEHTCLEVFIGRADGPAYHELNVAPSGAWQVHAFAQYRDGGPLADETLAPRIGGERGSDRVVVEIETELARLSPAYVGASLRLGIAAVIEDAGGTLSYWALAHPPGRPDFHHRDSFTLTLDAIA